MSKTTLKQCQEQGRVYVIAEAGLNHNGSVEIARKMIDVAVEAGVDAVKFQKRTVDTLAIGSVLDAPDDRFPAFGQTYRQVREHIEFDEADYKGLMAYCQEKGIDFLCTAFDTDAVDFLEKLDVGLYKLASHSLTNLALLRYLAPIGKPVILSTGMAEWDEIDRAVAIFKEVGTPLYLLHCVSAYPTPVDQHNLSLIGKLSQRYGLPVGYSGHEMGYLPSVVAVAMGATLVERHYTLDRNMVGFDHKISLEPQDLAAMVRDIRVVESLRGSGEKQVSKQEMITRHKYHVSMASTRAIRAGECLTEEMITWRNPGDGIPSKELEKWLGRVLAQDVAADVLIKPEMFKQ
ncbi:MAG: N-acetylneuraminate synthase family protein [Magnetococcales bacterium]|nr:N-acetylneuraminate synthase family protein [Magnetococcales bacterium]